MNAKNLVDAESLFLRNGCVQAGQLLSLLGQTLWSKIYQIGYFEVSVVFKERGQTEFVTKPETLAKYIPSGLAHMLDHAKALVSSLTYGIVKSSDVRGRIKNPSLLINAPRLRGGYVEGLGKRHPTGLSSP